jgi:hypothetical protein
MGHIDFVNLAWWFISYAWQEYMWAILAASFAVYFPRMYNAAVSLGTIRRRGPSGPHENLKIGLSPVRDGSVFSTGQNGDQAGLNFRHV